MTTNNTNARTKLLYVYEERIPKNLQDLVLNSIPDDEFEIDRLTYTPKDEEKTAKFQWAEVVLFAPGRYLPETIFRKSSHIKLMQLWSSGYDKFNTADARKYEIPVANNGGANAVSVAEHTILMMLAVNKRLPDSHRRTIEGKWSGNSHGMDMFLLHGKTLGIIGFGNIGRKVSQRARGFEMQTVYYDPIRASKDVEAALGARFGKFDEVLAEADVLSLHLHLNESTARMIGRRELAMMKPSAIIINVSRAQLIDPTALFEALQGRAIRGVGLDVYEREPTEPNDPLLTHPSVVATPHMAGSTYDAYLSAMANCIKNFRLVRLGEKPLWIVNGVE
jgi:phosphoglycerate dehydrogenase-like enzyme